MSPPSLRRLALADATEETIRQLINHGEDLLVERKRELPDAAKFGATVASFANTIGGWILLGVEDGGTIVGHPTEPTLDMQSHLGHLLRNEVEPVPPFAAAVRQIDDTPSRSFACLSPRTVRYSSAGPVQFMYAMRGANSH
jgi:predicted HTH transcriptional regulator